MSDNLPAAQNQMAALDLTRTEDVAKIMVASGLFPNVTTFSKAAVKVMAGRELGLGAFASMQAFDIVEGKLRIGSGQLASWVKASTKYDYRIRVSEPTECRIEWLQREDGGEWDSLGFSSWTDADRERAGLSLKTKSGAASVWGKFPTAMMFNRAMSNGVAMFCPDVVPTGNRVYTEGDHFGPADLGYAERTGQATEVEIEVDDDEPMPQDGEDYFPQPEPPKRGMSTPAQHRKIMTMCRERGVDDTLRHARMKSVYGVESVKDLTKNDAGDMIERLAMVPIMPDETPAEREAESKGD